MTLREAQIVIEGWRRHYNRVRPHSSLGYKPPAPEAVAWPASPAVESAPPAIALRPAKLTMEVDHSMQAPQTQPAKTATDIKAYR